LGSNDRWLNGIGSLDVLMSMVAFERINNVRLEIRLSSTETRGKADLQIMCAAHAVGVEIGEAPSLASVSVTCLATNLKSLDAALIHALYLLDGKLASNELGGTVKK
jgi:hypothetical protein